MSVCLVVEWKPWEPHWIQSISNLYKIRQDPSTKCAEIGGTWLHVARRKMNRIRKLKKRTVRKSQIAARLHHTGLTWPNAAAEVSWVSNSWPVACAGHFYLDVFPLAFCVFCSRPDHPLLHSRSRDVAGKNNLFDLILKIYPWTVWTTLWSFHISSWVWELFKLSDKILQVQMQPSHAIPRFESWNRDHLELPEEAEQALVATSFNASQFC